MDISISSREVVLDQGGNPVGIYVEHRMDTDSGSYSGRDFVPLSVDASLDDIHSALCVAYGLDPPTILEKLFSWLK